MRTRDRQLLLLGLLIVAFVWVVVSQLLPGLGGGSGPAARRPAGGGGGAAEAEAVEVAELRLEALEHRPATYTPGRDPFRFAPRPQPKPARPNPPPAQPPPQPQQQPQPAQPQRPPRPQPPPVQFVYLGSFGVPGREIAVFSDGKQILNAFTGDVLQQEFVVRSIGYESADIGFVNFPDAPPKRLAVGG